jgi:hypothetical protein
MAPEPRRAARTRIFTAHVPVPTFLLFLFRKLQARPRERHSPDWRRMDRPAATRISLGAQPAFDSAAFCSAPLFSALLSENAARIIVCKACARLLCNLCNISAAAASRTRARQISTAFLCAPSGSPTPNAGIPRRLPRYAHFHSVGCYYGLYPLFKTGYSNRLDKIVGSRTFAEEIWRWNLA